MGSKKKASKTTKKLAKKKVVPKTKPKAKVEKLPTPAPMVKSEDIENCADDLHDEHHFDEDISEM